jgi:hypothetical protein
MRLAIIALAIVLCAKVVPTEGSRTLAFNMFG